MGVESFLKRTCKQTAVYWASPSPDSTGRSVYDDPVEIKCKWKDGLKLIVNNESKEVVAKSIIYVFQDLDEQGMLFLGELTDLTVAQKADPRLVGRAYEIKFLTKTPSAHLNGQFARKAII